MCSDWHTWGCPIFVLRAENQSGLTGTPKWEPRARTGVYLGHSPAHAGNVALVLNLITGHVSPQYHVVFDDEFTTVDYLDTEEIPPSWENLVENSCERATDEQYNTARTWYEGDEAYDTTEELSDDDSDTECEQTRETTSIDKSSVSFATPLISRIVQHEKTREQKVGSSVGSNLGTEYNTLHVGADAGASLGASHDINQVGATVGLSLIHISDPTRR